MSSPHPDFDRLAEFAERESDPSAATGAPDLAEHVDTCPECAQLVRGLREVRRTLRTLPSVAMPPEVSERITRAVRAELTSGAPAAPVEIVPPARRPRQRRLLAVAAAVVVVVGVVVGSLVLAKQRSTTTASSEAAGSRGSRPLLVASGTDYTPQDLPRQIAQLLVQRLPAEATAYPGVAHAATSSPRAAMQAPASIPPSPSVHGAAPTAPTGRLADRAALQACVTALAGRIVRPLLADFALFQGNPATVMVFPDPDEPQVLDVYVEAEGADCHENVTYFARLPAE